MVSALRDRDAIVSDRVAAAVSAVPRHLFAPDEPLERAYEANTTLAPKTDANGEELSVVSAAHIQAVMLEQAQIERGMNVLEIGSGGYNAALMAELVGPEGSVTTVDIDPDIVARARVCLDTAGYDRVRLLEVDAEHGVPEYAPFDRIIVTAGAWDIPPVLLDQLAADGMIVVPLLAHGPDAEAVAARYLDLLRRWARDHRRRGAARIAYVLNTADTTELTGWHAAKRHGLVAVTWS